MNFIDKAIKAISPERALKREVAKKRLSMINSGYGNYGAIRDLRGWIRSLNGLIEKEKAQQQNNQ